MLDVKIVVQRALNFWYISIGVLLLMWIWAGQKRWSAEYRAG